MSLPTKKSHWNKIIRENAHCSNVIFDNIDIDPFYIATKCKNKSTIDLSRATIIDNWSMLRKRYTGLSLVIVFLLTFIFFLPFLTRSFLLINLSKIEGSLIFKEKIPLWDELFFGGRSGIKGYGYLLLTIILILYNAGRIWMTISIAKLREEERFLKDSDFALISIHPTEYARQLWIDNILRKLFWISFGYGVIKIVETMFILVPDLH